VAERPQTSHRTRNAHPRQRPCDPDRAAGGRHPLEPLDQPGTDALYRFISPFHMPDFVVLTGYWSRRVVARLRSYVNLVCGVAVPYVILQILHPAWPAWSTC
jgi:hypothetical protein